jgi:hypothetical protein
MNNNNYVMTNFLWRLSEGDTAGRDIPRINKPDTFMYEQMNPSKHSGKYIYRVF